jgi:hypothetical protein
MEHGARSMFKALYNDFDDLSPTMKGMCVVVVVLALVGVFYLCHFVYGKYHWLLAFRTWRCTPTGQPSEHHLVYLDPEEKEFLVRTFRKGVPSDLAVDGVPCYAEMPADGTDGSEDTEWEDEDECSEFKGPEFRKGKEGVDWLDCRRRVYARDLAAAWVASVGKKGAKAAIKAAYAFEDAEAARSKESGSYDSYARIMRNKIQVMKQKIATAPPAPAVSDRTGLPTIAMKMKEDGTYYEPQRIRRRTGIKAQFVLQFPKNPPKKGKKKGKNKEINCTIYQTVRLATTLGEDKNWEVHDFTEAWERKSGRRKSRRLDQGGIDSFLIPNDFVARGNGHVIFNAVAWVEPGGVDDTYRKGTDDSLWGGLFGRMHMRKPPAGAQMLTRVVNAKWEKGGRIQWIPPEEEQVVPDSPPSAPGPRAEDAPDHGSGGSEVDPIDLGEGMKAYWEERLSSTARGTATPRTHKLLLLGLTAHAGALRRAAGATGNYSLSCNNDEGVEGLANRHRKVGERVPQSFRYISDSEVEEVDEVEEPFYQEPFLNTKDTPLVTEHGNTYFKNALGMRYLASERRDYVKTLGLALIQPNPSGESVEHAMQEGRQRAKQFEHGAFTGAKSPEQYAADMKMRIQVAQKAKETIDSSDSEDEEDGGLQHALDWHDSMVNYEEFLLQQVAAYVSSGNLMALGADTFRKLPRGSKGRADLLAFTEGQNNQKLHRQFVNENKDSRYDGGYDVAAHAEGALLSSKVNVVSTWRKEVRARSPLPTALHDRALGIAKTLAVEQGLTAVTVTYGEPGKRIIASMFIKKDDVKGHKPEGKPGDFVWEVRHNRHPRTLYIFNDNARQHATADSGGGNNGAIRPYNMHGNYDPVRAAGISTGDGSGIGYQMLSESKGEIDNNIREIKKLLRTGDYTAVKYSSDDTLYTLGTDIFKPSASVREYITEAIHSIWKADKKG